MAWRCSKTPPNRSAAHIRGGQPDRIGEIGVFSFNGNKIITTAGGGMFTSRNESWVEKSALLCRSKPVTLA